MFKQMVKISVLVYFIMKLFFAGAEDKKTVYEVVEAGGQIEVYTKKNPPVQDKNKSVDERSEQSRYSFCEAPMQEPVKSAVMEQLYQSCDETALEDLKRVRTLKIIDTPVESINSDDFSGLENLTHLYLYNNRLRDIQAGAFKNLKSLRHLVISRNMLDEVDENMLSSLKDLNHLDLSNNFLQKLPKNLLSFTPQLQYLNLSHNSLGSIDDEIFFSLPRLQHLDLSYNKLTEAAPEVFSALDGVEDFNISHNQLKQIDVSAMRRLVRLNLSYNQLSDLGRLHFGRLAEWDASHNDLTFIPWDAVDEMQALTSFDYSANSLDRIEINPERDLYDTGVDKEWYDCWLRACGNIYAYISVNGERYKFMKCRGDQPNSQCTPVVSRMEE